MTTPVRIGLVVLVGISSLSATPEQDSEVMIIPPAGNLLRWYGHAGRTYFIQCSDAFDPLRSWQWSDMIEYGDDGFISHEVGSTAGRAFFRLHYTDDPVPEGMSLEDWDADGDGLSNLSEITPPSTNPLKADTSGDGISDGWAVFFGLDPLADNSAGSFQGGGETNLVAFEAGLQALPGATLADHDGDEVPNEDDADSRDPDVVWPPAAEGTYLLVDVDPPLGSGTGVDVNDKGEVLFRNGILAGTLWIPCEAQEIVGTYTNSQNQTMDYSVEVDEWLHFNNSRDLIGRATYDFTSGPGTDDGFSTAVAWTDGQSPINLGSFLPSGDYPGASLKPLGVDEDGKTYARLSYAEESVPGSYQPTARIAVFEPNGNFTSLLEAPAGRYPNGTSGHFDVSPSGWVASNSKSSGSPASYRLAAWDSQSNSIALPPEADGFFYPVHLADLPGGTTVLNATYDSQGRSHVFLPDEAGQMSRAEALSSHKIELWSGDGTALTSDGKVWVNGRLVPLEEVCPDLAPWLAPGNYVRPLATNSRGDFLVEVGDDLQTVAQTKVLSKTDLRVAIGNSLIPEEDEDTAGAWAVVNWDDDDGDAGAWGHGQTDLTSDLDDTDGVVGEDDLLRLGIRRISTPGTEYRLRFDSGHIRIWRENEKNGADPEVLSEQTIFTIAESEEWHLVHIEGIKPHDDDEGTIVSLEIKLPGGQWEDGDTVKIRVAHPIVLVYGDKDEWNADKGIVLSYLKSKVGKSKNLVRDTFLGSTLTHLIPGKNQSGDDVCYSVTGLSAAATPAGPDIAEKYAKLAFQTEKTNICFTGHCNYGVGLAFGTNFNSFDQFFNMAGGGYASISRDHFGAGSHKPMLPRDPNTLRWRVDTIADRNNRAGNNPENRNLLGQGILENVARYPHVGTPTPNGSNMWETQELEWENFTPATEGVVKWHYIADPALDGNGTDDEHSILNTWNSDIPANLRYRSLLLNQCNTYRSFIESFQHGVVIASMASVSSNFTAVTYLTGIAEGWDWEKMDTQLDEIETSHEDPNFPLLNAFQTTEF